MVLYVFFSMFRFLPSVSFGYTTAFAVEIVKGTLTRGTLINSGSWQRISRIEYYVDGGSDMTLSSKQKVAERLALALRAVERKSVSQLAQDLQSAKGIVGQMTRKLQEERDMAKDSKTQSKANGKKTQTGAAKDMQATANQADRMTYTYQPSGENGRPIVFYISNENASQITPEYVPFEQKCDALMKSALNVRRQNLFTNVDLAKVAKECYSFKPFTYQIENVNTMLNRFEGHGVFGDQVGLGKTVQGLMTAHVMFLSGVIRNAVIVVPKQTVDGWKKEIEEKFPNIFTVITPDRDSNLEFMLRRIDNENKNAECLGKKRVYILTDEMLNNQQFERMAEELSRSQNNQLMKEALSAQDEALLTRIRKNILDMCSDEGLSGFSFDPQALLESYGWNTSGLSAGSVGDKIYAMGVWNLELCRKTVAMLEEALKWVQSYYKMRVDITGQGKKQMEMLEKLLAHARKKEQESIQYSEYRSAFTPLFQSGEDRLIDLMIVDEVHSFYSQASMENLLGHRMTAVNILADIEKKYCVLLSATPIRTRLEDVFDLIYLVARDQMGYTRREAEAFFYETMCQVSVDEPNKLAYMVNENKDRFFGLVNNYFTRKRIADVKDDMKGFADLTYAKLQKDEKIFINGLRNRILDHVQILYAQDGREAKNMLGHVSKDYTEWTDNDLTRAPHLDEFRLDHDLARARMRSAIDFELISVANNPSEKRDRSHMAHSLADWRRRGKKSLFVELDLNDQRNTNGAGIVESKLTSVMQECRSNHANPDAVRKTLSSLYISDFGDFWNANRQALSEDVYRALPGFVLSLKQDAAVYYAQHLEVRRIKSALEQSYEYKRDVNAGIGHEVTLERYNTIAVVDQAYQAGVNLQKHSAFVFVGMKKGNKRIMDPVDIEQWIGRVHRTGQVKDCHIVTLVDEHDVDRDFLRQYYILLSDPQGLDLYGDTTPDVAFLQPVIVDFINNMFDMPYMQSIVKKEYPDKDTSMDGFARLIHVCYLYDMHEQKNRREQSKRPSHMAQIRDVIRELCQIPEFGKPGVEQNSAENVQ